MNNISPVPNSLSQATRNALVITVATIVRTGIQFVWSMVLAQLLGAADFGTYGTLGGIMALAGAFTEFGIGLIVLRDVAQDHTRSNAYYTAALTVQAVLSVLGYAGLLVFTLTLSKEPVLQALLPLVGLTLFVEFLGTLCYNMLLAYERMITTSVISIAHILLLIGLVSLTLLNKGGLIGLYLVAICAGVIRSGLFWVALRRAGVRFQWPASLRLVRRLLHDSYPLALAWLVRLAYQHIDKLLTYLTLGSTNSGYLTVAFIITFGVIEVANSTLLVALFPMMSRLANQPETLQTLTNRLANFTLIATLPLCIGISLLAAPISALLFPGFAGTASVLSILIWHVLFAMISNFYSRYLMMRNRQRISLFVSLLSLAVNIIVNVILLPRLGVSGAGISAFLAETVALTCLLLICASDGFTYRPLINSVLRTTAAAIVMISIIAVLRANPLMAALGGSLAYLLMILGLRVLTPEDWQLFMRVAHAIPVLGPFIARRLSTFIPQP